MRRINPSVLRLGLTSNWRYNSKALNYTFLNKFFNHFDFFFKQKINNLQTSRVRWKIRRFHFRKKYLRRRLISYAIQNRSKFFLKKWFKRERGEIFDKEKELKEPLISFFSQPKFSFMKRISFNLESPRFVKKSFNKFKKNSYKRGGKKNFFRKSKKNIFPINASKYLKFSNLNVKNFSIPSLPKNQSAVHPIISFSSVHNKNNLSLSPTFSLSQRRFSTSIFQKKFDKKTKFVKKLKNFNKSSSRFMSNKKNQKRLKINQFLSRLKSGTVLKPQDGWWTKKILFKSYNKTFNFFSRFVSFRFPVKTASWRYFFHYSQNFKRLPNQLLFSHAPAIRVFSKFYKQRLFLKKTKSEIGLSKKKTFFFTKPYQKNHSGRMLLSLSKKNSSLKTVIFKRLKNFSALIKRRKAFKRSSLKLSNYSVSMRRRLIHVPFTLVTRTKKTPRWTASKKKRKSFKRLKKLNKNKKYSLPMKPWNFKRYLAHTSFKLFRPIVRRFKTVNAVEKISENNFNKYPLLLSSRNAQLLLLSNLSFTRLIYQAPVYAKLGRFGNRLSKKKGWHRLALLLTAAFHWRNVALIVSVLGLEFRRTRFHYRFFKIFGKFLRLFLSNQIFFLNFVIRVRGCFGKIARTRSLFLRPLSKFHIPMFFSNYNYPVTFSFKHVLTRRGVFSFAVWCV
jgi:hypothetical protein